MIARLCRITFALLLAFPFEATACGAACVEHRDQEGAMSRETVEAVLDRHRDRLMSVPGVVGTAVGDCAGKRCIKVLVAKKTRELVAEVPATLEGFQVAIEETGEIRALETR